MSAPRCVLSVVLPTLGSKARLGQSLPGLCRSLVDLEARLSEAGSTELVVVDDSGEGVAAAGLTEALASLEEELREVAIQTVRTERNLGFGPAVMRGAREANGTHLLVLHDDVLMDAGSVNALLQVLAAAPSVFAAAPVLSRPPAPASPVPARVIRFEDDWLCVRDGSAEPPSTESLIADQRVVEIEVVRSAAMLVRRGEFLDLGGFDRLFGPTSLEDADLSICARRRGRRLVQVQGAEALHLDLGDGLGDLLEAPVAQAVAARNRLLLRWKHLSTRADASDHLIGLWRVALEAGMIGDRETLEGIVLAVDRLGEMAESRATLSGAAPFRS